jgi:hypothetical protein
MADVTVTGLTKDRMLAMEAATIIDGNVVGNNLHLITRGGTDIDAGNVRGPTGAGGPAGSGHIICTSTTRPVLVAADEGKTIYEKDTDLVKTWTGSRWKLEDHIICTSTTRPAVVLADEGVRIRENDTNLEYTWTGSRWMIQQRVICTSTTRPTGLTTGDEGVQIYETDTSNEYTWDGTAWVTAVVPGVSRVLHEILRTSYSIEIGTTAYTIPGYNRTIPVVSGRKYYVRFECRCEPSVSNTRIMINVTGAGSPTLSPQYAQCEYVLPYSQWISFMAPIIIGSGNQNIFLNARSLESGKTFQMSGAATYPGLYQIIEIP